MTSFRSVRRSVCTLSLVTVGLFALASPTHAESLKAVTTTNVLISFDSATPGTVSQVAVSGLQAGETILGIDFRPATGDLYALGSTSRLYTLNSSGAATQIGAAGEFLLSGTSFGFDFNPTTDRIRVTSDSDQNLRLNPNDGSVAAVDGPLSFSAADPNSGADPRVTGSAYTNNFQGAVATTLFAIDSNLDSLLIQNPPNGGTLNTVGPLGFNFSDLGGFDISGLSGIAYAALTAPAGNTSQLFTINLANGAATLVGTIGSSVPVNSLAAPIGTAAAAPVPEPATLVLMAAGLAGGARRRWRAARRLKGGS